ncbi:NUDIX domain-containing protein [Acidovorax sp. SUPP3434]|uniref:NUDIX hydrolase n=1 Tax=Acidovorax sp. SUPP3434 TaxID=2920880 RepID=UPI0023DE3656|nr:NUDIX domain-containing protein [Acidovorax sp. SUPP3434]GKS98863.1 NUDIX domain-containing protein [Acidovorax sp. SUPP3434]
MSSAASPAVICTVDTVLLTLQGGALHALLVRRDKAPYAGAWALPGGYIHAQDDADAQASAARVLREKAGLQSPYLEQLATFSGLARDPRGWSLAVAYCALVPGEALQGIPPRQGVKLVPADALPPLPFDHRAMVDAALARVRSKSLYSSLPVHLCGDAFTLPQLQAVYEAVLGEPLNKVSFRRKMDELDMLEPVPGLVQGGAHRPAQMYRLRPAFRKALALSSRAL